MKSIRNLILTALLLVTGIAAAGATTMPNGVKGLEHGMSKVAAEKQLAEIAGKGHSIPLECKPHTVGLGYVLCESPNKPPMTYAKVPVSRVLLVFRDDRLECVSLQFTPANTAEAEKYETAILRTLISFMSNPDDSAGAAVAWDLEGGSSIGLVDGSPVQLNYMSAAYGRLMQARFKARQASAVPTAKN